MFQIESSRNFRSDGVDLGEVDTLPYWFFGCGVKHPVDEVTAVVVIYAGLNQKCCRIELDAAF